MERTYHFNWSEKTESQTWGRNGLEKKESKNFLDSVFVEAGKKQSPKNSCFFTNHFFLMSGTTNNDKFSLHPFQTFFSTRVLETNLVGLKAACIGPALSKFRPSVGDGANQYTRLYNQSNIKLEGRVCYIFECLTLARASVFNQSYLLQFKVFFFSLNLLGF